MAKIHDIDEAAWREWVESRPPEVKAMCERLPPNLLYRMNSTGQRVTLHSYSENGTVTVNVTGEYNFVTFERQVFGISPDDLEECDLPGPDELIGAVLTEDTEVDAFIDSEVAARHERGEQHNRERCALCSPNPTTEKQP
jgi:hypothetical protein